MATKPIHLRLSNSPTKWLRNLPKGEYNMKELEIMTNRCVSTIKQRLNLLNIPKRYNATSGYPLVVYIWEGIDAYEERLGIKEDGKKVGKSV